MTGPPVVVCAPLFVEWLALRGTRTPLLRTGMGPRRATKAAARLAGGVVVAGVGGGLSPGVRPGDVVVATEVRAPDARTYPCTSPRRLATELARRGLRPHLGPVVSLHHVAHARDRWALASIGALAVDTESAWLAPPLGGSFAVLRVITDTADAELWRPGIVPRGIRALRALRTARAAIDAWVDALPAPSSVDGATTEEVC